MCGAKGSDEVSPNQLAWRKATYENVRRDSIVLWGRAGNGHGRTSDVREVDLFGMRVIITG
jgi:hypothetical protein